MENLTEKVETLERRLDELGDVFDIIRKSLTDEHGKQRYSVRIKAPSRRPAWVEEIFIRFNEISAELRTVKETLGTRTFTDSGHSRSEVSATNTGAAPDCEAPSPGQPETEQSQAESGQRESVVPDVPEPLENPSATTPPDHDITALGLQSQPGQGPVCGALTTSTSTEPPNLPTQLGNARLDPQLEGGTAPTFRCNYKDISQNLNEAKFEKFSSVPDVKEKGYFKLIVQDLHLSLQKKSLLVNQGKTISQTSLAIGTLKGSS